MIRLTVGLRLALCLLPSACGGEETNSNGSSPTQDAAADTTSDASVAACEQCVPDELSCKRQGPVQESATFAVFQRTAAGCVWKPLGMPSTQFEFTCASLDVCLSSGQDSSPEFCTTATYGNDGSNWSELSWTINGETHLCYIAQS
jgi:hypothetical protein